MIHVKVITMPKCPECGKRHRNKYTAQKCFIESSAMINHCIVSGADPGDNERNRSQRMTKYYNTLTGEKSNNGIPKGSSKAPLCIGRQRIIDTMKQFNKLSTKSCRKALVYQHKDKITVDIPITRDVYMVYDKYIAISMGRIQILKINDVTIENMTKKRTKYNPIVEICFILSNSDILRFLLYEGE